MHYVVYKSRRSKVAVVRVQEDLHILPMALATTMALTLLVVSFVPSYGATMSREQEEPPVYVEQTYLKPVLQTPKREHTVEPTLVPEVVAAPIPWNISQGNNDGLGNAVSIYRFLTTQWENELEWLTENYQPSWPYGVPCEANPVRNLNPNMAIAIAANSMRECSCNPSLVQGGGSPQYSNAKGCAYGLFQFDGGIRWNYLRFADALGKPHDDLETQLHFVAYSYYSTGAGFYQRWQKFSNLQDLELSFTNCVRAAEAFRIHWECGGTAGVTEEILRNWGNKWNSSWGDKPDGGLYNYLMKEVEGNGQKGAAHN